MLGKLFKHEWKTASKMLLLIHGAVILFAILSRIFLEVSGGLESESIIAGILIFTMVMAIGSTAIFNTIYIANRFYKNVFTDQGYLTNTLPVTPTQIILSKGFVGILWMVIDFMFLCLSMIILFATGRFFSDFAEFMQEFGRALVDATDELSFWLTLISMILAPIAMVLEMYFSVSVGNLFSGHKVLGAVGTFIGIYTIQQIITTIGMTLTGYKIFTVMDSNSVTAQAQVMNTLNSTLILSLVITIACTAAFWFGTKYIMTKKLNLQ